MTVEMWWAGKLTWSVITTCLGIAFFAWSLPTKKSWAAMGWNLKVAYVMFSIVQWAFILFNLIWFWS